MFRRLCKAPLLRTPVQPVRALCGAVIRASTTVPQSTHRLPTVFRLRAACLPKILWPAIVIPQRGRPEPHHVDPARRRQPRLRLRF